MIKNLPIVHKEIEKFYRSVEAENSRKRTLDLSRVCTALGARLGDFPFESDQVFPTQC